MCTATKDVRFVPTADIPHRINKSKKDYLWLKRALAYQAMDESALSFEA
jgi:predicted metal-binding transcription factor (methanogenesis marker protein 9)